MLNISKADKVEIWTGNQAVAEAVILTKPEIVAAYPITPSTPIIQALSDAYEEGRIRGEFIAVESEHAAMSGAIGASVAGARTFTATASQGLLYMAEMVYWAGFGRLPMSMCLVNRALAPGWSIWVSHEDLYSMRDAGWIQLIAKNTQEAHDLMIHSFRLSEHHDVYMPSMVNIDGFVLSHVAAQVHPLSQKFVDDFLPPFEPMFTMDPDDPISFGALTLPNDYLDLRKDHINSMNNAKKIFTDYSNEFAELTGRYWGTLIETYGNQTGDVCIISMGSMSEEVEEVVDELNKRETMMFGSLRLRSFRPFPTEEIQKITNLFDTFIVLDRAYSLGSDSPLLTEIRNCFYKNRADKNIIGKVIGMGGADVNYKQIIDLVISIIKETD